MREQWTGDWMRDAETGQLIDGPTMNRYQMFLLIRELRAVIRAHAQTIREKQAVIDAATDKVGRLEAPDSDAEWDAHAVPGNRLARGIDRISFRIIVAARAKEPKP